MDDFDPDNLPPNTAAICNDCPWRRDSTPGWLGPNSAEAWVEMAHGEAAIACHLTIKKDGDWDDGTMRQCLGVATFRRNVFKSPRHPKIETTEEPDHEKVFSSSREFIAHHTQPGAMKYPKDSDKECI